MLLNLLSDPISLIGFLLAIIIGITVHEFAHAWMAYRLGDFTAKYAGRLSLSPARHLDFMGTIFLFLVGFGWGKPVPININALKGKHDELKIALAGPLSNLIIAFLFSWPIYTAAEWGINYIENPILLIIKIIIEINIILAVFNLIPIYPLDGSRILRTLAPISWQEQIRNLERSGPLILFGLIFIEYVLHISIIFPIIMIVQRFFSSVIAVIIVSFIDLIKLVVSLF